MRSVDKFPDMKLHYLLFAGFTATMATSDFSQLYIIGFEFPLLSFAAPHDSVAVERPLRSR